MPRKKRTDALIQLLSLFDNLLLIFAINFGRSFLLHLVTEVRSRHFHFTVRGRLSQSKIRIVQHLNGQVHTFGAKVKNKGIALEIPVLIRIQLDSRLPLVNLFRDYPAPRKHIMNFLNSDIQRKASDIDGGVFAFPRLPGWFGFLRAYGATALFLWQASALV